MLNLYWLILKRIAFHTLGCKLNFSETSTLARGLKEGEYQQVSFSEEADIYVINSCSVTANAEKRCRELIRRAVKVNPNAHVAVVGCYSQINPEQLKTIPGVDLVLGNADKFNLYEHIENLNKNSTQGEFIKDITVNEPETFVPGYSSDDRTRSFFKVQDGCDYFCTYCTIPLARGHSRSNTIAQTIKTANEIAATNVKEVVLSGVNIGDFGKAHGENFEGFLKELIKVEGLERIRISSIEPDLLTHEIIELVGSHPVLMPHFHIPLQSGSDKVLRDMGRRYDTQLFISRLERIKQLMPHACIAVDLIVGFPTESMEEFENSYNFLRKVDISYLHVFPYSERRNTRAVKFEQKVPMEERQRRSKQMQQLSDHKKQLFYEQNQGLKTKVLWEKENAGGWMYGFTENYIKVKTRYNSTKVNTIEDIVLGEEGMESSN